VHVQHARVSTTFSASLQGESHEPADDVAPWLDQFAFSFMSHNGNQYRGRALCLCLYIVVIVRRDCSTFCCEE